MSRFQDRKNNNLRPTTFETNYVSYAEGSVLISMGNTRVLCNASIEDGVPRWMKQQGEVGGWITGEYSMLPRAGLTRSRRERNGAKGRTQEIQRLIGRSLRAALDLKEVGEKTITLDCDVIQADGGTRTASITGAYVALRIALDKHIKNGDIPESALLSPVAAISAGIFKNEILLDLCYEEDVAAEVDANFVMNEKKELIEVQGTAEGAPFSKDHLLELLDVSEQGITQLISMQKDAIAAA